MQAGSDQIMKRRTGFTLVELVVRRPGSTLVEVIIVVLILGIIAAVVVPRLFDFSAGAIESGLKQDLYVIRDAIDQYAAHNYGALPVSVGKKSHKNFIRDLGPYVRRIPESPVGKKRRKAK